MRDAGVPIDWLDPGLSWNKTDPVRRSWADVPDQFTPSAGDRWKAARRPERDAEPVGLPALSPVLVSRM